jgi:hypothetical protein
VVSGSRAKAYEKEGKTPASKCAAGYPSWQRTLFKRRGAAANRAPSAAHALLKCRRAAAERTLSATTRACANDRFVSRMTAYDTGNSNGEDGKPAERGCRYMSNGTGFGEPGLHASVCRRKESAHLKVAPTSAKSWDLGKRIRDGGEVRCIGIIPADKAEPEILRGSESDRFASRMTA